MCVWLCEAVLVGGKSDGQLFAPFYLELFAPLGPVHLSRSRWNDHNSPWSNLISMSVATPTVLPRPPLFPNLMPRPQQPYPTPLAVPGRRAGRLIARRDLVQEMDDLSDEEAELEDSVRTSKPHAPTAFFL